MYGSQHKERKSSYQFTDKPLILHLYYPLLLLIIFCHLLGLGKSERVALAARPYGFSTGHPRVAACHMQKRNEDTRPQPYSY